MACDPLLSEAMAGEVEWKGMCLCGLVLQKSREEGNCALLPPRLGARDSGYARDLRKEGATADEQSSHPFLRYFFVVFSKYDNVLLSFPSRFSSMTVINWRDKCKDMQ